MNTFKLSNGIRIIHKSSPTNVAYCGIAIDAGTRDEMPDEYGIAHFCEHIMFKGTKRRKSWHIINRMESVGGDLNAYTNKEETVVYAAFMKEHISRAVELISDIVFNSTYPQTEIDKEKDVIVEEIESYNDSPADLIFDEFEDFIYEGADLGHDILGKSDEIRMFNHENLTRFVSRMYSPFRMVFFVFGDYEFDRLKRIIEKETDKCISQRENNDGLKSLNPKIVRNKIDTFKNKYSGKQITRHKNTHQAHVMIGCRAYAANDPRRIALYFLNNIIGGPSMNSLLNIVLREHNGLVYNVESNLNNYTDTSTFSIYFGCDEKDIELCISLVREELEKLMNIPLSRVKFNSCLRQIKGQIGVSCDNFESYALDMCKSYLHYDKFEGIEETYSQLDSLSPEMLQDVSRELFCEDNMTTLIYR